MKMEYIKIIWVHNFPSDPLVLFYELNELREVVRLVEFFPNGSLGFASNDEEYISAVKSGIPIPRLDEIAKEGDFFPFLICKERFEVVWEKAKAGLR